MQTHWMLPFNRITINRITRNKVMLNSPLQSDRSKNFAEEANIFYDAANKRIATYEEVDISRAKSFYHEILLFNEVRIVNCSTFGVSCVYVVTCMYTCITTCCIRALNFFFTHTLYMPQGPQFLMH